MAYNLSAEGLRKKQDANRRQRGVPKSAEHRRKIGDAHRGKKRGPSPFRLPLNEVIARLKATYSGILRVRKFDYDGPGTVFTMVCPTHGEFRKTFHDAIYSKTMCPKCVGRRLDPKEHLQELAAIYPDMDFRKSVYTNAISKVEFRCKKHKVLLSNSPNRLRNAAREGKGWTPCVQCRRDKIEAEMYQSKLAAYSSDTAGYLCYRQAVRRHSNRWFKASDKGYVRTRDFHMDHRFSIYDGWKQGVPPEIVGHKVNLRMMPGTLNRQKSRQSSITKKELLAAYRYFNRNSE